MEAVYCCRNWPERPVIAEEEEVSYSCKIENNITYKDKTVIQYKQLGMLHFIIISS